MTAVQPKSQFTPDDLVRMEDDGLFELVDGKLVEKQMGYLANWTAGRVTKVLSIHADKADLGVVVPEQSFRCFPNEPERIRRPDVAFITASRAVDLPDEGYLPIAPDIAIEVVSPTDLIYDLDEKLADYRSAGVKLVWVINPKSRTVRIHRPDHSVTELDESGMLTGESILPDFSVAVTEILPPASAVRRGK
jgi:Uma2 family endonuclease